MVVGPARGRMGAGRPAIGLRGSGLAERVNLGSERVHNDAFAPGTVEFEWRLSDDLAT